MAGKKKFTCSTCKKSFSSKANLNKHATVHKKGNYLVTKPMKKIKPEKQNHKCDLCGKLFPSKFKLIRHGYSHMAVKPFPCDKCGKRFSRKDHLQVHYRIHTGEKTCFCTDCGEGFNTTTSLHRHIVRLHSEERKTFMCMECGLEFGFKAQLKRHYDFVHKECYTCNFCGNISSSEGALHRHLRKHILSQPYVCLMCAVHFNTPEEMKDHQCFFLEEDPCKVIVRVALNDSFDFENEIDIADETVALKLEKKFDNRGRKPKQLRPDQNTELFNDELYDFFAQEINNGSEVDIPDGSSDGTNVINVEDLGNAIDFLCKFCDKSFPSKANKLAHESTHLDGYDKSPRCTICNTLFSTRPKLIRHLRSHTRETPYLCKFCEKTFTRRDYLQRHMFSVHATDDETCPFCFELCSSADQLKEHMKIHEINEKSHLCEFCTSSFPTPSELELHIHTEHSNGKYRCKYCLIEFDNSSDKSKHEQDCEQQLSAEDADEHRLTIDETEEDQPEKRVSKQLNAVVESWRCKPCNKTFKTLKERAQHMKSVHRESFYFECELCPCKFTTDAGLRGHTKNFHGKKPNPHGQNGFDTYSRTQKGKTFDAHQYACVRQQKSLHHCKDCGESFHSIHDFLVHVRSHSNNQDDDGLLSCVLCHEDFESTEELYRHLENHEDSMIVEVGVHDKESDDKE